jgi:hypothetical protein
MNNQIPKGFKSILSDFKQYLEIRIELIRLNAIEKGAKLVADLLSNAIVLFFLIIAFLASAVTLAFYLSSLLHSYVKGFGFAALFFMLLVCVVLWKKDALEKIVAGVAIRRYFEKHCENGNQEDCLDEEESGGNEVEFKKPWL